MIDGAFSPPVLFAYWGFAQAGIERAFGDKCGGPRLRRYRATLGMTASEVKPEESSRDQMGGFFAYGSE